jgi:hypothetical protein
MFVCDVVHGFQPWPEVTPTELASYIYVGIGLNYFLCSIPYQVSPIHAMQTQSALQAKRDFLANIAMEVKGPRERLSRSIWHTETFHATHESDVQSLNHIKRACQSSIYLLDNLQMYAELEGGDDDGRFGTMKLVSARIIAVEILTELEASLGTRCKVDFVIVPLNTSGGRTEEHGFELDQRSDADHDTKTATASVAVHPDRAQYPNLGDAYVACDMEQIVFAVRNMSSRILERMDKYDARNEYTPFEDGATWVDGRRRHSLVERGVTNVALHVSITTTASAPDRSIVESTTGGDKELPSSSGHDDNVDAPISVLRFELKCGQTGRPLFVAIDGGSDPDNHTPLESHALKSMGTETTELMTLHASSK